jgi:hypothetical protein
MLLFLLLNNKIMKANLIHGVLAGVLSALASVIYLNVYQNINFVDFSSVLNAGSIIGASIMGCLFMAIGYILLDEIGKPNGKGVLNLVIIMLTSFSILSPLLMDLPLELDFPELFPALAIPMHLFPAMLFFGLDPFFKAK